MDVENEKPVPMAKDFSMEGLEEMLVRAVSKGVLYGGLRLFLMVSLIVLGFWVLWFMAN